MHDVLNMNRARRGVSPWWPVSGCMTRSLSPAPTSRARAATGLPSDPGHTPNRTRASWPPSPPRGGQPSFKAEIMCSRGPRLGAPGWRGEEGALWWSEPSTAGDVLTRTSCRARTRQRFRVSPLQGLATSLRLWRDRRRSYDTGGERRGGRMERKRGISLDWYSTVWLWNAGECCTSVLLICPCRLQVWAGSCPAR